MQLTLQWDVELINDENIDNNGYIDKYFDTKYWLKINENYENIKKNSKKII